MRRTVSMSLLSMPPTTISLAEDASLVASSQSAPVSPCDSLTSLAALTLSPSPETPSCTPLSNRQVEYLSPPVEELMTAVNQVYQSTQDCFPELFSETFSDYWLEVSSDLDEALRWFKQNETPNQSFCAPQENISLLLKEIKCILEKAREQFNELDTGWDDDNKILSEAEKDRMTAAYKSVMDQLQAAMNKIEKLPILPKVSTLETIPSPKMSKLATIPPPIVIEPINLAISEEEKSQRSRLLLLAAKIRAVHKTLSDAHREIEEVLSNLSKFASQQLMNKIELIAGNMRKIEAGFKMLQQALAAIPQKIAITNQFSRLVVVLNKVKEVVQQEVTSFQNHKKIVCEEIKGPYLAGEEPNLKLTQGLLVNLEIEFAMALNLILDQPIEMSYFLKKAQQPLRSTLDKIKVALSNLSKGPHPKLFMLDLQHIIVSVEIAKSIFNDLSNQIKTISDMPVNDLNTYEAVLSKLYFAGAHAIESDDTITMLSTEYPENVELTSDKLARAKELLVELDTAFTYALSALDL